MTRQIAPDDAHSIAPDAPDIGGDVRAQRRGNVRPAGKAEEPDRPPQHDAPAAPLDHATIRAIVAGIMLAMFLSRARADHRRAGAADDRRSLVDVDHLSWVVTAYLLARRRHAAVRQALRHLWPARPHADQRRRLRRWLDRLCARPHSVGAGCRRAPCRASAAAASCRSPRPSSPTSCRRASGRSCRATRRSCS